MSGRTTVLGTILWAVAASLFWVTLAQFDPLGATSAANLRSEATFMRLVGGPWYDSAARDRVVVVLIDDAYLHATESSWPLSYAEQELLLEEITGYGPAAVFLDVLHQHYHAAKDDRGRASLRQLLERVIVMRGTETEPGRAPLFVPRLLEDVPDHPACPEPDAATSAGVEPALVRADVTPALTAVGARRTYIGWTGCGTRYPAYVFGDPDLPTPAFALYRHLCAIEPDAAPGCVSADEPKAFARPMMVRWGSGASELTAEAQRAAGLPDCTRLDTERARFRHLREQLRLMVKQMLGGDSQRGRGESCPYTDTLHASYLVGGQRANRDWLQRMLRDRVVLIGTRIEGVHDTVVSPVNGQMPGVYLLAMALDNYLEYGKDYYHDLAPGKWLPGTGLFGTGFLLEVIALLVITSVSGVGWFHYRRWCTPEAETCRSDGTLSVAAGLGAFVLFKLILPVSLSLLVAWVAWKGGSAPFNWIAIAILAFVANPVRLNDCTARFRARARALFDDACAQLNKRPGAGS